MLRAANLNLLPILRALLREGGVSRAAAALHLSQPATSNALNRLRALLGDPLLVQIGRTMHLTPRAQRLLPLLDSVCGEIELLLHAESFVPAEAERTFVVATPDYMALLLGPDLIDILKAEAPNVSVRFTEVPDGFRDEMIAGGIDVAIVAWIEAYMHGLSSECGYRERLVGVAAKHHPLAKKRRLTADDLNAHPQISIQTRIADAPRAHEFSLLIQGEQSPVRLGPSHLLILPLLAARTHLYAVAPKALADYVAELAPMAIFELPGAPASIEVRQVYSPINHADPAQIWFRGVLDRALSRRFERSTKQ